MTKSIFFVHVPKTAGTSFRIAAAKYFGDDNVLADYGVHSPTTSEIVCDLAYKNPDLYKLSKYINKEKIRMLTGHVRVQKYNPVFPSLSTATFLRHPVEQVLSHYEHYIRHLDYQSSFDDFVREERFTNIQYRLLGGIPLEFYGFIGITDRYNDSIDLFNYFYKSNFEKLSLNTKLSAASHKPLFQSVSDLDQDMYDFIAHRNRHDMRLYQQAKSVFEERYRLFRESKPFSFGFVRSVNRRRVFGVAFGENPNKVLTVEILRNGEVVAEIRSAESSHRFQHMNIPRLGFVGFSHDFADQLDESDEVLCRIKDTQQLLNGSTKIQTEQSDEIDTA